MTAWQQWMLFTAMLASVYALALILALQWIGQPPIHCRYLVPVASAPGIYACSKYPHARAMP